MKLTERSTYGLVSLSLGLALTGCGAPPGSFEEEALEESAEMTESALSAKGSALRLTTDSSSSTTEVRLCFKGFLADDARFAYVRDAVRRAAKDWDDASTQLTFPPIEKCGSGVKVRIGNSDGAAHVDDLGRFGSEMVLDKDNISDSDEVWDHALHEIGHLLGLPHEQLHPDSDCDHRQTDKFLWWEIETGTEGDIFFDYDRESIMNYCATPEIGLTSSDIDGIQRLYGGANYFVRDGQQFLLRNDTGQFITKYGNSRSSLDFMVTPAAGIWFRVHNVGKAGQEVTFGDQVYLEVSSGEFMAVRTITNPKAETRYELVRSSEPYPWTVGGEGSGKVNVNEAFSLSADAGGGMRKLQIVSHPRTGAFKIGVTGGLSREFQNHSRLLWRALGPSRTSDVECALFDQLCGAICCGIDETCVSPGQCEAVVATPPPPPDEAACGVYSACETSADCPGGQLCGGSGCCFFLH